MSVITLAFKRSCRECKIFRRITPLNILYSLAFDYYISQGKSKSIVWLLERMSTNKNPLILYYLSKTYFLIGKFHDASKILLNLNTQYPIHADIAYLLSECYRGINDKNSAREILEKTLDHSHRLKTWLMLANLVEDNADYQSLKMLWKNHKLKGEIPAYHYSLDSYISTAAMRSRNYGDAIKLWQSFIIKALNEEVTFSNSVKSNKFSSHTASKALVDLKKVFASESYEFFLVSGTLLGCMREGKLLSHDKDIDVGIWSDVLVTDIIDILKKSGKFYIQPSRSHLALRIKHVNGTAIDIFLHFREKDNYWHGGSKLKWNNTPFNLVEHNFLKNKFLIPKQFNLYLSENYGSWRVKKTDFDSAFDTPNAEVINEYEMKVHTYKALAEAVYFKDSGKIDKNILILRSFGEENFCEHTFKDFQNKSSIF